MSEEIQRLKKSLETEKKTIVNYHEQIAYFRQELSITSSAVQKLELIKRIENAQENIKEINIQIESLRKEIGDMERLPLPIVIPPPPPIRGRSIIPISKIPDNNPISPTQDDNKDELDDKIEVYPPPDQNHINLKGNYDKLSRLLLEKKEWKAADLETMQVMLQIAKKTKEGWLTSKDILNITYEDLKKIDYLWLEASNGKFGYLVQRNIWLEIQAKSKNFDGSINYNPSLFLQFADQVGWRVNNNWLMNYDDFDFSLTAPDGHLPTFRFPSSTDKLGKWRDSFKFFLPRL